LTGQLILTSSAARDGCRALLSQVDLHQEINTGKWPSCGNSDAGRHSWDAFALYSEGPDADEATVGKHCLGNLPAMTAGLLASRFPYLTPSGVVGSCNELDPTQLIDGGYTDNTGLGTINALGPLWVPLVQIHNDGVLADGEGELIMPVVVFLENGTGGDYSVTDRELASESVGDNEEAPPQQAGDWGWASKPIPEILIPPVGNHNARDHKVSANTALARSRVLARAALCTPPVPGTAATTTDTRLECLDLLDYPLATRPVFVIHQTPQPSIAAPLGWSVSSASVSDLDADMDEQAKPYSERATPDPARTAGAAGYGSLYHLLAALGVG